MPAEQREKTTRRTLYAWSGPPEVRLEELQVSGPHGTWKQVAVATAQGRPGAVIVATCDAGVLLVRQERPAVGQPLWELPRGFGDAEDHLPDADQDQAVLRTALREVREETGLDPVAPQLLGWVWPDSGLLTGRVAIVSCRLVPGDRDAVTGHEVDAQCWVRFTELQTLIRTGVICDGLSLAALSVWHSAGDGGSAALEN